MTTKWLPLNEAAEYFGYAHKNSLSLRLRQLRERGHVVDVGNPPEGYSVSQHIPDDTDKIVVLWPHPKTALIRNDAPRHLLDPKPGKRGAQRVPPSRIADP